MADEIRVPAQPGTDFAVMTLHDRHGQLTIARCGRSRAGNVYLRGSVELSKYQQIALRDWLCNRWGGPDRG